MGEEVKLAFSTNAFTRFSLIEALRGIKRAGFSGVEILADTPHAYPGTADARIIRGELDQLGLAVRSDSLDIYVNDELIHTIDQTTYSMAPPLTVAFSIYGNKDTTVEMDQFVIWNVE